MPVIDSSNEYFEFYKLIHQVKLTDKDRTSLFISVDRIGEWNIKNLKLMYEAYEEEIKTLKPSIAIAKKEKIYDKLFSTHLIQEKVDEYIKSLVIPKGRSIYNENEFLEYLKFLFLADISFIYGLYFNELETEKNNINTHGEVRAECKIRLEKFLEKVNELKKIVDNPNYNYSTSDFKSQLNIQRIVLEDKIRDLEIFVNKKTNYPERMLAARLADYIFSNYGMYVFKHMSLIKLFIDSIEAGGSNGVSSETLDNTMKNLRKKKTYMRVPKKLRKGAWRSGWEFNRFWNAFIKSEAIKNDKSGD